ncbi:MAG: hypothetical protein ACMUIL_01985 [bacterium]
MRSPFVVTVKCPECGGPIRFPEGAYAFTCTYCGSVLRIKQGGNILKYIIQPRTPSNHDIQCIIRKALMGRGKGMPGVFSIDRITTVYKPFWYFKGMLYLTYTTKGENDTIGKTWYYSFQACPDFAGTFNSLSVRTEVLAIEPYDSAALKGKGTVLPASVDRDAAYTQAAKVAETNLLCEAGQAVYKRLHLIGEHLFLIYYPVMRVACTGPTGPRTFLIDGIGRSLIEDVRGNADSVKEETGGHPYTINLLSHRCKNCGHDLPAGDFDIIFYCAMCGRLWLLKDGDYHSIPVTLLNARTQTGTVYLPFWRFEVQANSKAANLSLKTIQDLSGLMKMGRFMLRNEDPSRPIRLYVPALVTRNARALLKLAATINRHQRLLPVAPAGPFPHTQIFNASLPLSEAEEMLDVILFAVVGRQDPKALNFYNDHTLVVTKRELVWYPFEDKGNFYLDHFHQYTFAKKSMDITVYR